MINEIIEIILNYVEPEEAITADTDIKSELGMSSFDLVCLADEIFEKYGVSLTPDNFRDCATVGSLADFIAKA